MADETNETKTEETTETKKEGKISGFFKKVGKKLDDAAYDSRLASDFEKKHVSYKVYTGTGLFTSNPEISAEEHFEGDEKYIIMYGEDDDITTGCLIKKDNDSAVYHIAAIEPATLNIEFEGKQNEKPATKIVFGEKAQKVNVIKVEDDFYLA